MGQPVAGPLGLGVLGKPLMGEDAPSGFDLLKGSVTPTPMMLQDQRMMGFASNTMSLMRGGSTRFLGGRS